MTRLVNTPADDLLPDDRQTVVLQDIFPVHLGANPAVLMTLAEPFITFSSLPVEPPGAAAPSGLPPGLADRGADEPPSRPEQPVRPELPDWPLAEQRPERAERPDRPDRPEKPDRPERPDPPANDDVQHGGGGPADRGKGVSIETAQALLLSRFDADGNTGLSLAEILAVLDRNGQRSELRAHVETLFGLLDEDDDALLEAAEIEDALRALDVDDDGRLGLGGRPQGDLSAEFDLIDLLRLRSHGIRGDERQRATAPTIESLAAALIDAFDTDEDGAIELAELLSLFDPDGKRAKAAQRLEDGIDAIDTSSDNGVTLAELSAALTRLDADDDGRLAAPERHAHQHAELGDIVALIGLLMPSVAELG